MLNALAFYIPEDRRHAIAQGETLAKSMRGSGLYADISGFTPLTEALVHHHGPQRGAEELTQYLDRVYNALIQQVHQYGGSVIGYSGDAITCWFNEDDGQQAIAAALGMQTAIEQLDSILFPSGEMVSLAVKVAVVVGDALRLVVGDPAIQLFDVMGGSVSERLAIASQIVYPGEVVVDAATVNKLSGILISSEQRQALDNSESFAVVTDIQTTVPPTPWPDISPDTLTEGQLRSWVLPAINERMRQGHVQFLTELRPAIAIFLHFEGIDYEHHPEAGEQLDAYVRWVQAVLARYEGVLLQVVLGEKGSYLYSTFGAPVAHEDDARRALAAAWELNTPPNVFSFIQRTSMGISRGIMRTGPTGSALRRTYGVFGDEVNVAARLMEAAAPGEIIITERVAQRVSGLFETQQLPALKVKGKAQPLPAYRVMGPIRQPTGIRPIMDGQLVGRAAERAQLDQTVAILMKGESNMVCIEGEAGIGKSRLVGDWLGAAAAYDLKILTGSGDSIEQSTPYHAWRPIFNQLLNWDTLSTQREALGKCALDQLQALGLAARAPLLNVVLQLDLPDNDLTIEMNGKVRADNTHEVLVALLQQAAARQPLLIVIEDAHWLDSASWALALAVARHVHPLLFALVTRPLSNALLSEYQALLDRPGILRLRLEALIPDDVIQLVCQRLDVDTLPEQVNALILEKAEGHPFFSEELAYALRDSGVLRIINSHAQIAPGVNIKTINLPDTVEGVVTSRIDLLTPGQQLAVKVASVIGRVFGYRVLEEVYPVETDRPKLADYLATLQQLNVTSLAAPLPHLSYMFKHITTQQAAYGLLLFAQRRELHQVVAEWYERSFAKDLSPYYPLLAHHWLNASTTAPNDLATVKAVEYLERAGEAALRNYANREAVEYFDKLLAIAQPQNAVSFGISFLRMAQWEQQLGEAYNRLGYMVKCEQHFRQALKCLHRPLSESVIQIGMALAGQIARQTLLRLQWTRATRRSLTENELEARRLACKIYERLGLLYFLKNNPGLVAFYCPLASTNLAEEIGPSPELAIAYSYVAGGAGLVPAHWLARLYERLSLQTAEQVNNPLITARVLMATSVYSAGAGRFAETAERLQRAIAAFEQGGVWEWWGVCMEMLTRVTYYQGQFQRSAELADRLYTMAKQQDDILQQSWSLSSRMETHFLLADRDDLLQLSTEMEELATQSHETGSLQKSLGVSALVHLQRGEWAAADESVTRLLNIIIGESPTSFGLLTVYSAAAEVSLGLWEHNALLDSNRLKQQAALACKLLTQYAKILPIGEPAKLRAHGLRAWLSGGHKQARALWRQSLKRAREMEMPLEEARANYELGRHLPPDNPLRQMYLERAQQLSRQLGVCYLESRIQDALK